ncbi:hypothetical protein M8J76_011469 [Diaphorina citri]|nr:hypothetical protein M8J76_011469 [Diaphorina citri]
MKWDIVGLAEIRRNNEVLHEMKNGYVLLHTKADKSMFGTGYMVKNKLINNIIQFTPVSKRVAVLKIKFKKTKCTIIQIHAPTTDHKKEEIENFYEELDELIRKEQMDNERLIVLGDFNACVGSRQRGDEHMMGTYGTGKRNESGKLMSNFTATHNLKIVNTYYKHKSRWTWKSPNDSTYEIDYILTNNMKNIKEFTIAENLKFDTDHRLLMVTFIPDSQDRYNSESVTRLKIKNSEDIFKNHLEDLLKETDTSEGTVQDSYNQIEQAITNAVYRENQTKRTEKRKYSLKISATTRELIEKREKFNRIKNKTAIEKIEHSELRKLTKKKIREDIQKYEEDVISKIMEATGSTKKIKREISNVKASWIHKMKREDGTITTNREEILEEATKYYENLYKNENTQMELETYIEHTGTKENREEFNKRYSIMKEEIDKAIDELKKEKAPGHDCITNELIITGREYLVPKLQEIFNRVMHERTIPEQWSISKIILLYKKGAREEIGNYRPISLSSCIYKIFTKIIQQKLRKKLDENQPQEQAGFRSTFSTIDNLQTINQILEKCREYQIKVYISIIDYKKAFDSIYHGSIWKSLRTIQVDDIYIQILQTLYKSKAYIALDKKGRQFEIKRGTKQGCPLSAELFNTVLEQIFRNLNWEEYGLPINGKMINNLRFADDVILIGKDMIELKTMIKELEEESKKQGLLINTSKTKILTTTAEAVIDNDKETIKKEKESIYLGQLISCDNIIEKEVERRIKIGWSKYWSMKKIFKSMKINEKLKTKALKMCIFPAILYGCQTWALTKKLSKRLDVTQYQMFRSILHIKRMDKISNRSINEKLKMENLSNEARRLKWRWAGHVMRMSNDRWAKMTTEWIPRSNKRARGRKKVRWCDEMVKNVGAKWQTVARDRKSWENIVKDICK